MLRGLLKCVLIGAITGLSLDSTILTAENWFDPCTAKGYLGDIALTAHDVHYFNSTRHRVRRAATNESERKWPGAVIPFAFRPDWTPAMLKMFYLAMREWEQVSCVQFSPAKPKTAHILFAERDCGCCSYVGKQKGQMPQGLSIGRGCDQHGTILHELGHAIGFWHEMSRPDRDQFVDIKWENIREHHRSNFDIETNVDSLGEAYDPYSIMHYGNNFFTSNGRRTIRLKPGTSYKESQMGQRGELTGSDIRQANRLHKCRQKCGRQIDANNWRDEITHNNVFKSTLCEWRIVSGPSGSIVADIQVSTGFVGRIRVFDGPYKADNNGTMAFDSRLTTERATITSSSDRLVVVIYYLAGSFHIKLSEVCGENLFIESDQEELLFPAFYPFTRPSGVTDVPTCKWNLSTQKHHILELNFKHFRVEPNELTVDTKNGTRLRIFNGIRSRWTPPTVTSFEAMSIQYDQLHHQR